MEVFLQQVINNKKHTKTACSSRAAVQYINIKILHFYKGYFTNFYQMKLSYAHYWYLVRWTRFVTLRRVVWVNGPFLNDCFSQSLNIDGLI